jgi:DNA topoisomerase-1
MTGIQEAAKEAAKEAGLRYMSDAKPGIARRRAGKGWRYTGPDGETVRDENTLVRIKSLAIPPAWREVWICPSPNGHIQATGLDAKDRKQYRYHPRWREVRDQAKYERMMAFGKALPKIRRRIERDLALPGLPREKLLATVVRLLETTLIRVGNEEYARANQSFGLTTMRDRHVQVEGAQLRFNFKGKSGKTHSISIQDRRLARVVRRCQDLPGQELFQYEGESGEVQTIDSGDVNDYLKEISGDDFTAKDFRTWAGTMLAAIALQEMEAVDEEAQSRHNVVAAIERVAERLGNTPAICRQCYVHPAIIESYMDGTLIKSLKEKAKKEIAEDLDDLPPEEAAVLVLLHKRLDAAAKK